MATTFPHTDDASALRPGYRDWAMIGGLLLVMTVCHGIITSGLPALDSAILADLGISRAALKLRETIFLLSTGCSGLAIGFVAMRWPPSRIVIGGLLLLSGTLTGYGHAHGIGQIYALYVLLGMCFASSHVVVVVLMVRARFSAMRTLATAIALSGTSIGGATFPSLAVLMLEHFDWRSVLRMAALLPLALIPIVAPLIRSPRGRSRQDTAPVPEPGATSEQGAFWCLRGRRRPVAVTLLLVATFGTFFASTAFLLNLFLYLQDIGLDARQAALGMSAVFLTGLVGKVAVGVAAERWGSHRVWNSQQLLLLAGALLLSVGGPAVALVGLVLLGAGWAGCYVLTQVVIAESFAGPRLGRMTGAFIVFESIASGSGVWFAGRAFDLMGSYRPAFLICTGLIAVAALAAFLFRGIIKRSEIERGA